MSLKTRENEPNTGGAKKNTRLVFIFPYRYMCTEYHNFNCFFSFLKICTFTFLGEPPVYLVFQSGQNKHIPEKLSFQGY